MDYFAMAFYGVVCGLLGFAAPAFPSRLTRVGISALVGIVSPIIGPTLRGLVGM